MITHPNLPNNRVALSCLALVLSASIGQAQGPSTPPLDPAAESRPGSIARPSGAVTQPRLPENLAPGNRDPFWPVGYAPKSAAEIEREKALAQASQSRISAPKWSDAKASLRIGGYIKTPSGYAALVNNSVVAAGDIVSLIYDGKQYRWKIESVSAHGISFAQLDYMQPDAKSPTPGKDRP